MLYQLFQDIHFEWPWALWLLAGIPLVAWQIFRRKTKALPTIRVSEISTLHQPISPKIFFRKLPLLLRIIGLAFLIIALARPVRYHSVEINEGQGIEIVLCLDVSGSMLAQDFLPSRLQASLDVAEEFIRRRKGDRIGLVVFAGQSLTLCPITTDHQALLQQLASIQYGILNDGTSIGSGLASAVERLRKGEATSKIIVLLTDGEDTGGKIDPVTAKKIAITFGIKVYTIGVGTEGYANIPYKTSTGTRILEKEKVSIDEKLLKEIAQETGGIYYRARNTGELENIYTAIDALEKSEIQTSIFHKKNDAFLPFLFIAIGLIFLDWLLAHTWLRRFP